MIERLKYSDLYSKLRCLVNYSNFSKLEQENRKYYFENKEMFKNINTYCAFIGYPRSDHSLVGAILNAHKQALISHELDAYYYIQHGISKEALFSLIYKRVTEFYNNNLQWGNHNYKINEWQGKIDNATVIGDKKGGLTTFRLRFSPKNIAKFQKRLGIKMKFIHVTRNPFDNISRIFLKNQKPTLNAAIKFYSELVKANNKIKSYINPNDLLEFRHEDLVLDPKKTINDICDFLGLELTEIYLKQNLSILYKKPNKSRQELEWTNDCIDKVNHLIGSYSFLKSYQY